MLFISWLCYITWYCRSSVQIYKNLFSFWGSHNTKFFKSLANRLNMKLHFTSGYHPDQTEHTNQTLEQFLRIYYNYQQSDWPQLLPLAEFTYNNTLSSSTTRTSPFFTNKGYYPRVQFQVQRKLSWLGKIAKSFSIFLFVLFCFI